MVIFQLAVWIWVAFHPAEPGMNPPGRVYTAQYEDSMNFISWIVGLWRTLTWRKEPCDYQHHDLYMDLDCPVCGND
jgi:hypothetical protein